MMLHPLFLAPLVALGIGLVVTRAVRWAAPMMGFVDNPDLRRKLHEAPIALGGGIAVWIAAWCGWGIGMMAPPPPVILTAESGCSLASLAVASFLVLALGAVDDRF